MPSYPLTVDATVIELPARVTCGVCHGQPLPGDTTCPQCAGAGVLPVPALPACSSAPCDSLRLEQVATTTAPEQGLPVYRCERGHFTAVRYIEPPSTKAESFPAQTRIDDFLPKEAA